ncbi:hypothetical protein DRQ16_04725, partial [bacterium]
MRGLSWKEHVLIHFWLIISRIVTVGTAAIFLFFVDYVFLYHRKDIFSSAFVLYAVTILIAFDCVFFGMFFIEGAKRRWIITNRKDVFEKILFLPVDKILKKGSGYFTSRIVDDCEVASGLYTYAYAGFLGFLYAFFIDFTFISLLNAKISLVVFVSVAFLTITGFILSRKGRELGKKVLEARAGTSQKVVELAGGIHTVRVLNAEQYMMERMKGEWKNLMVKVLSQLGFNNWMFFLYEGLPRFLSSVLITGLGGYYILLGKFTLGRLIAMRFIFSRILSSSTRFIEHAVQLQNYMGARERVYSLISSSTEFSGSGG